MDTSAEANRAYVRKLVAERGWTEELTERAQARFDMMLLHLAARLPRLSWERCYARAYSDGHNIRHLSGKRLDHYAHCYADSCEAIQDTISFGFFWAAWEAGDVFEGTPDGNWHFAATIGA